MLSYYNVYMEYYFNDNLDYYTQVDRKAPANYNIGPLLKPSILDKLAQSLIKHKIDISNLVTLAQYLIEKIIPFLDTASKGVIFDKVLSGQLDWHLIKVILPYADYMIDPIEAAVLDGALPYEVMGMIEAEGYAEYVSNT